MTLHITHHGDHGMPLVFFHGWGFDNTIWHQTLKLLPEDAYQVYCVDLPGFGLSGDMDFDAFKSELFSQIPLKVGLIGWSLGGLFATRLAIESRARVSHLMNVASSPCFVSKPDWPGIHLTQLHAFHDHLIQDPVGTRNEFIRAQLRGTGVTDSPVSVYEPTLSGLKIGLDILTAWDLRGALSTLDIPVSYLFGRLDTITPVRLATVMKAQYPSFSYTTFSNAAHMPFLSNPKEFMAHLKDFLI